MDFTNAVTSKCTSIASMFSYCQSLRGNLIVTGWNTTNVTTMSGTFRECYNLNAIVGVEDFNLVKCTTLQNAFYSCRSLIQNEERVLDLSNWFTTQTTPITTLENLFKNCSYLKKISIRGINISTATTVTSAFSQCRSVE